jgi:hypothetical protein
MRLSKKKYYITNVLKKPQRVNVHQFIQHVEQLNPYIAQMLCFYYSPSINTNTKPENVPVTEAELGSHVLRMCPIQWQDQYNLNEKGVTPMDLRSLMTSLEANVFVPMRRPSWNLPRKLLTRARRGRYLLVLVPNLRPGFPRKSVLRRIATCAKGMGARTPRTIPRIVVGMRKTERRNPISMPLRKAVRKPIPSIRILCS